METQPHIPPQSNMPAGPDAPSRKQGRIVGFLHRVLRSCYDMEFYRGVRIKPWGSAFTYLLLLNACIALAFTALLVPTLWRARGEAMGFIDRRIPAEATLAVHNGKFATNLGSPFNVKGEDFEVLVDTTVTGLAPSDAFGTMPGVFVGQDVVVMKDGQKLTTYKATEFPEFSVKKEQALDWLRTWSVLLVAAASAAFLLAYFVASVVAALVFVTLAAAAMSVVGGIWKVRIRFDQWHALGMHAVTLPTFVGLATRAFDTHIPYAYAFIYFMIMAAVIADEKARPTPAAAA